MPSDEPDQDTLAEAGRWLAAADEDLLGAQAILERDDVAPRLACFLAQQSAEKALKSRLIRRDIRFPRIHDLLALRALLPAGTPAGVDDADLAALSAWVVEARCPGDVPDATAVEARHAVATARTVLASAHDEVGGT